MTPTTDEYLVIRAFGLPAPKGSMKLIKGHLVPDSSTPLRHWTRAVATSAMVAVRSYSRTVACPLWTKRPIAVDAVFVLPRPPSRNSERHAHYARGDGDKLTRATWDALQGIVFDNDTRIVAWSGQKVYDGTPYGLPESGARIIVWPLDVRPQLEMEITHGKRSKAAGNRRNRTPDHEGDRRSRGSLYRSALPEEGTPEAGEGAEGPAPGADVAAQGEALRLRG